MLVRVADLFLPRGNLSFIRQSFRPSGMPLSFLTRWSLMAKPTPASRRLSLLWPLQKKVYPPPISVSWPLSERRVSLRAVMSTL